MQTINASVSRVINFSLLVIVLSLLHSSNADTCRDEIECSGAGYCLKNNTCICNPGVGGASCNTCLPNHFSYPACTYCNQETTCSGNGGCTQNGTCFCNSAYNGTLCDRCAIGFYGYPHCTGCTDKLTCNGHGTCSNVGECACYPGFTGPNCDACEANRTLPDCSCSYPFTGPTCNRCIKDHYNFPSCVECTANITCFGQGTCSQDGTCSCNANITGSNCNECVPGHYNYPACVECHAETTCNGQGTCNNTGSCVCSNDWTGDNCEIQPFYYTYYNIANVTSIVFGDPAVIESLLSTYDITIRSLTGFISRSTSAEANGPSVRYAIYSKLYSKLPCSDKPSLYSQKITGVFNSSQIASMLNNNGVTFVKQPGTTQASIKTVVSCSLSNSNGATLPAIIKSNSTAPPLPSDLTPTSAPTSTDSVNNEQADKLQSQKTAQSTRTQRDIRLGVGLGLGIGIPFVIAAAVAVYFYTTRKPFQTAV